MKKFIAIAVVGMFGVLSLGSCKKDYTCECTSSVTVNGTTTTTTASGTKNGKKKDVKEECEKGSQTTSYSTVTCKIK